MSRAKKKFASKFADSKVGKSVINKALGEASEEMMSSFKDLLVGHYGAKEGKNIINLIYKFAVKARMMFDKNKIDMTKFPGYKKLMYNSIRSLLQLLREENASRQKDMVGMCHELLVCQQKMLYELMEKNLTDKNKKLLKESFAKMHSLPFLENAATNPKLKEPRKAMAKSLHELLIINDPYYALDVNTLLDDKTFNAQYGQEIKTVQSFWEKTKDDHDRICMSVFTRLVEIKNEYYNLFQKCVLGDDPEKQYALLKTCADFIIKNLAKWSTLKAALEREGAKHAQWGPGLEKDIFLNVSTAFQRSMVKVVPEYKDDNVLEEFTVILRLIVHVLEKSY